MATLDMELFKAGERVFLPGSSGEPTGVLETLFATPGVEVLTSFVPGVNRLPAAGERAARVTGLFGHPGAAHLPLSYGGFARYGAADLRGLTSGARAQALIAVAAPFARSELTDRWRDIAKRLGVQEDI